MTVRKLRMPSLPRERLFINQTPDGFWSALIKAEDGCWHLKGQRTRIRWQDMPEPQFASRLAAYYAGIIPDLSDLRMVTRICKNNYCCNPRHLLAGSRYDTAENLHKCREVVEEITVRGHDRLQNPEFFFSLTRPSKTQEYGGTPCMDWIRKSMRLRMLDRAIHVRRIAAYYGRPHLINRLPRTPGGWEKRLALKTPPKLRHRILKSLNSPEQVGSYCGNPRCINPLHIYIIGSPYTGRKAERMPKPKKAIPANPRTLVHMEPPLPDLTALASRALEPQSRAKSTA